MTNSPAVPKKRSTWKTIAIVGAIVFVLCVAGGVFGAYKLFNTVADAVAPAQNATDSFLKDMESGNAAGAYNRLCAPMKAQYSGPEAFEKVMQSAPKIQSHKLVGVNVSNFNGRQTGTVTAELTFEGRTSKRAFPLVVESGDWKVCGSPF